MLSPSSWHERMLDKNSNPYNAYKNTKFSSKGKHMDIYTNHYYCNFGSQWHFLFFYNTLKDNSIKITINLWYGTQYIKNVICDMIIEEGGTTVKE